jgi:predicted ArsR family transcriptional regulator
MTGKFDEHGDHLLVLLLEGGSTDPKQAAEQLGWSQDDASELLAYLKAKGFVTRQEQTDGTGKVAVAGPYTLTDRGKVRAIEAKNI